MKKLKAAFYTFYKSLSSPPYYKDLLNVDFSFSVKYFFVLMAVAFTITTPGLLEPLRNDFNNSVDKFVENSKNYFPEDLVIEIKDGQININKPEPYILPVPESGNEDDYPENLVVIDSDGTINDLEKYNTFSLINKSNIIAQGSNRTEVYPLKNIPDTTITQEGFVNAVEKIEPYVKALPYILIPLTLIISGAIYFGSRIIYLTFVAFILWLFVKILEISTEIDVNYKKSYQIAIHAMTLPLLIEVIADVANYPINAPLWFLLVNIIFGMTAIYYIAKRKTNEEY